MKLLIDTNVMLWTVLDSPKLGVSARLQMKQADVIYVSAASIWEARIKAMNGKLDLPNGLLGVIAATGFKELSIGWEAAEAIDEVELPHRDPFDRMLVVQARQEGLMLLTGDEALLKAYPDLCIDGRE